MLHTSIVVMMDNLNYAGRECRTIVILLELEAGSALSLHSLRSERIGSIPSYRWHRMGIAKCSWMVFTHCLWLYGQHKPGWKVLLCCLMLPQAFIG